MTEAALRTVSCAGCGGRVADEDGPIHRYIIAAPGCWRLYTELAATGWPPTERAGLTVDAYAVSHPGTAGRQSTPSVWIHLIALDLLLERGWSADQAIGIRRVVADAFDGWPWLVPPRSMGAPTVDEVAAAIAEHGRDSAEAIAATDAWVGAAWRAWAAHHDRVHERADALVARFFA